MVNKVLQIGITGGIGSGKSLVCKIFNCLGIPSYNADLRARWLLSNDPDLIRSVKKQFGEKAYTENDDLDRAYMAQQVFYDDDQVGKLNKLVHPKVASDYLSWLTELDNRAPFVLKEAALLIETGSYRNFCISLFGLDGFFLTIQI